MAEILIKAVDHTHPDPEKDRRGAHKKGDIIVVMPDGHPWGAREGPPRFVLVRCPEVTVEQVQDRMAPWRWRVTFNVDSSNLAQDRHRITATNATESASGAAALSLSRVEAFLTRWGASIVSNTADSVTFDIAIADALMSEGFWGPVPDTIVLAETAYDSTTGEHTIAADYTLHPAWIENPVAFDRSIASHIRSSGGEIVTQALGVVTFTMDRADVRERFRADVEDRLGVWRRHRYYVHPDDVDTILANGGAVTVTATQLANNIRDRVTE